MEVKDYSKFARKMTVVASDSEDRSRSGQLGVEDRSGVSAVARPRGSLEERAARAQARGRAAGHQHQRRRQRHAHRRARAARQPAGGTL